MKEMLLAYGSLGYREYFLPDHREACCEIRLGRELAGMGRDCTVLLERSEEGSRFRDGKTYTFFLQDGSSGAGKILEDGMLLLLKSAEGWQLLLLFAVCRDMASMFRTHVPGKKERIWIGSDEGNAVFYSFQGYVSGKHAVLYPKDGRWLLQDMSSNGVYVNGVKVKGEIPLRFGDQIAVFGLRIVWLGNCLALGTRFGACRVDEHSLPRLSLAEVPEQREEGREAEQEEERGKEERKGERVFFRRMPGKDAALYTVPVEIDAPPAEPRTVKKPVLLTVGPSLTMAVPMLLGGMMAVYGSSVNSFYMVSGVVTAAASALIGAAWAAAGLAYTGRTAKEEKETVRREYEYYLDGLEAFLRKKQEENRSILLRRFPSGNECCKMAAGGEGLLWSRRRDGEGFLCVRLGTGEIPFQAGIRMPGGLRAWSSNGMAERAFGLQEQYRILHRAPVCVDMRKKGVIGLLGGAGKKGAYETARNIIAQIAAAFCYTDVKMAFIYEKEKGRDGVWSFARWLPHVWTEDGRRRMLAGDKRQTGELSCELAGVFRDRASDGAGKNDSPFPHYVLFVDGRELLEGELLESFLLHPRPEYGVTCVLLEERYEDLPYTCEYVIRRDGRTEEIVDMRGETEDRIQHFESVPAEALERLVRGICGIRVNDGTGGKAVPEALSFLDLYGGCTPELLDVRGRWKANRSEESLRVPIGQKAGGRLCFLDIHEKYHGPHGLAAGMTGSGKSELLQTLILSLAVNFSPEEVTFLLIDFKGGGMADLFADLPHMAGRITNLSGNGTARALLSVKSENLRRQRLLAAHGVNNINQYIRMYKNGRADQPLAHLVIIVDEFAELKKEEPGFMTELISVAQVGRSLGVHLILATQKPSGTVDERIWSNTRFRLCLRVQDCQDSRDMLHKKDAAYITRTGRGYLQVGNDEVYEEFQTGYSGAPYEEEKKTAGTGVIPISLTGEELLPPSEISRKPPGESQLKVLVRWIALQAEEGRYGRAQTLWLPPLPQKLRLEELEDGFGFHDGIWPGAEGIGARSAPVGRYDDPEHQEQGTYRIVYPDSGHLAVCGMSGTGKSTFLRTLVFALIRRYTPEELQFYALDYSGGLLLSLRDAPHCGGVAADGETEETGRLFLLLDRIMEERKEDRKRKNGREGTQPVLLVVLDDFSGFQEKTGGKYEEQVLRLSREGQANHMYLLVSGNGFGTGGIPRGIGEYIRTTVCLEVNERFKYAEIMRAAGTFAVPERGIKGRGIVSVGGRILEFQAAAAGGWDRFSSSRELERQCRKMDEVWTGKRPRLVPHIPDRLTFQEFKNTEPYRKMAADRRYLPLGYDQEDASICAVDLRRTVCWVIQGRDGTGKKNVMRILMNGASCIKEARLYLIDFQDKGLAGEAKKLGAGYLGDEMAAYGFFKDSVDMVRARSRKKRELEGKGMDQEETARQMDEEPPVFIFLSDLAGFIEAVKHPAEGTGSMRAYLENITEKGSGLGIYFFGMLRPEDAARVWNSRVFQNMAAYGTGIHLGGDVSGQRLFRFPDVPYTEQAKLQGPGTGWLPPGEGEQRTRKVVLPLVERRKEGDWQ